MDRIGAATKQTDSEIFRSAIQCYLHQLVEIGDVPPLTCEVDEDAILDPLRRLFGRERVDQYGGGECMRQWLNIN